MDAAIRISTELLARIRAHALANPLAEGCGILLGRAGRIEGFVPADNMSSDPARAFEIDPAALLAVHRAARAGGVAPIGHYHSHPTGDAWPSRRDAAGSAGAGALWLIVTAGTVALFRERPDGPIEAAFEQVALIPG